jgi:hypothetical protein
MILPMVTGIRLETMSQSRNISRSGTFPAAHAMTIRAYLPMTISKTTKGLPVDGVAGAPSRRNAADDDLREAHRL